MHTNGSRHKWGKEKFPVDCSVDKYMDYFVYTVFNELDTNLSSFECILSY